MGVFILGIFMLISWFILDKIFPGTGGLAIIAPFAAYGVSLGYAGVKALLKVKAGDNGASLSELSVMGFSFLGAIVLFFYNIIGLVIFNQESWYAINGKLFVLMLIGGMLVFFATGILNVFFYSRNLAREKGISLLGGFLCFIKLLFSQKKKNPSLGEENTDDTNDIDI